jgi:hypothetical protein
MDLQTLFDDPTVSSIRGRLNPREVQRLTFGWAQAMWDVRLSASVVLRRVGFPTGPPSVHCGGPYEMADRGDSPSPMGPWSLPRRLAHPSK